MAGRRSFAAENIDREGLEQAEDTALVEDIVGEAQIDSGAHPFDLGSRELFRQQFELLLSALARIHHLLLAPRPS